MGEATLRATHGPGYQRRLADALRGWGNIGVLLGPASGNLRAIDIDTAEEAFPGAEPAAEGDAPHARPSRLSGMATAL
jgi:hypothetical protein